MTGGPLSPAEVGTWPAPKPSVNQYAHKGANRALSIARSVLRRTKAIDAEGTSDAADGFALRLRLEQLRNLRTALTAGHTHVAR